SNKRDRTQLAVGVSKPYTYILGGELKKSVLQSLKEFQARAKAQEQENKEVEKSKAHKKGDVEL
ncbi:hypothetical protein, partial [Blautia wexlerae]|uniref:hypothetical protein n=1 Tax=Blautia wexlerae TaxID=418240 RepID=UPI0034A4DCEB